MSKHSWIPDSPKPHDHETDDHKAPDGISRRDFLKSGTVGVAAGALAGGGILSTTSRADDANPPDGFGDMPRGTGNPRKRTLLKGGVVLTMNPTLGDYEKADVLIEGKKILAIYPNISAGGAEEVDARGMIVMPGFITTHHHQYETLQRSVISDGLLTGNWPLESYGSVVQNIWTAGRIGAAAAPTWDLGRSPYDPEDCYISELVASLSQLTQGITCSTDTSQSSHTPQHTDAMIEGLIDSGARVLFDYSGGTDRGATGGYNVPTDPYEYPGAIGDETKGIGRIAKKYFSSKDQLVTLGHAGGPTAAFPGATYTGWQLARAFGAFINNHNVGAPQTVINAAADPRNGTDWSDVTFVHCVRWQDSPLAQISYDSLGYPNASTSTAWDIWRDRGAHSSVAVIIEMQMRHGMPPFQQALNHGILPSLSPDVDTNMTPDPFSLMRGAFTLQRALANDLAFPLSNPGNLPIPQLLTCTQIIEMVTVAGAAGCGLSKKVGTLEVGKEADIVMLDARQINVVPMNNVPGTVVTMMDTSNVRHVFVAGKIQVWNGQLVGWNVNNLSKRIENARDRVLARIRGPALAGAIPKGNNSFANPYRPNFLGSCCYNGQNTDAPAYVYRP